MKVFVITLIIILGILIFLIFFISIYLAHYVCKPHIYTTEKTIEVEKSKNLYYDYDSYKKEDFIITSFDGYKINGTYIKNNVDSNKYVIISHGYTYTRYGSLKYLDLFYKLGYNCIIYDDRGHGINKRCTVTMGLKESKDLIEVINATYKKFGDDIYLGLHGESMGSGLEIMALKYHPNIKFVVNDCGYGKLKQVLKDQLKLQFHLPAFLVDISGIFSKLLYGYNFNKVNPIESLKGNEIPICFIHGTSDTFINYSQSLEMSKTTSGYQEVHLFEGAEHAKSFEIDNERYRQIVSDFLNKIGG